MNIKQQDLRLLEDSGFCMDTEHAENTVTSNKQFLAAFGQNKYNELCLESEEGSTKIQNWIEYFELNGYEVIDIAAGNEHSVFLVKETTVDEVAGKEKVRNIVFTIGYNNKGQCGVESNGTPPNRFPLCIRRPEQVKLLDDKNIVRVFVSNGAECFFALSETEGLFACGNNGHGQLGVGDTAFTPRPSQVLNPLGFKVVEVSCSYFHTILRTDSEEVFSFGRNDFGQLGLSNRLDQNVPRCCFPRQLVRSGSIKNRQSPCHRILSIACGVYHSLISVEDKGCFSCGKNDFGQLGMVQLPLDETLSTFSRVSSPLCEPASSAIKVSAGYYHSVCVMESGLVYAFGRNDCGQLGLKRRQKVLWPHLVESLASVLIEDVICGAYHTIFVASNREIYGCGRNNFYQLGIKNHDSLAPDRDVAPSLDFSLTGGENIPTEQMGYDDKQENDNMHMKKVEVPLRIALRDDLSVLKVACGFYHTLVLSEVGNPSRESPTTTCVNAFQKMLNKKDMFSDFILAVDNREILVHKGVLAARSEYFNRMLASGMSEVKAGRLEVQNVSYNTLFRVVEFIYTGKFDSIQEASMSELLEMQSLAELYFLPQLGNECLEACKRLIANDTVISLLHSSYAAGIEELIELCIVYVAKDIKEIMKKREFVDLPKDILHRIFILASETLNSDS